MADYSKVEARAQVEMGGERLLDWTLPVDARSSDFMFERYHYIRPSSGTDACLFFAPTTVDWLFVKNLGDPDDPNAVTIEVHWNDIATNSYTVKLKPGRSIFIPGDIQSNATRPALGSPDGPARVHVVISGTM